MFNPHLSANKNSTTILLTVRESSSVSERTFSPWRRPGPGSVWSTLPLTALGDTLMAPGSSLTLTGMGLDIIPELSSINFHDSRFTTHVISAILNIGQSVTREWELHILDNSGAAHAVTLLPGEMIWYESARLLHGRPDALLGDYFDNLFIHYKPTHLWYSQQAEVREVAQAAEVTMTPYFF